MTERRILPKKQLVFQDHRIAQIFDANEDNVLTDAKLLQDRLLATARELKFNLIDSFSQNLENGVLVMLVFKEATVYAQTWSDKRYIMIDWLTLISRSKIKFLKEILKQQIPAKKLKVGKIFYD